MLETTSNYIYVVYQDIGFFICNLVPLTAVCNLAIIFIMAMLEQLCTKSIDDRRLLSSW